MVKGGLLKFHANESNFASNFVVGATGFLLNRDEVLPKELREKLDIKNFKDKPWNSTRA